MNLKNSHDLVGIRSRDKDAKKEQGHQADRRERREKDGKSLGERGMKTLFSRSKEVTNWKQFPSPPFNFLPANHLLRLRRKREEKKKPVDSAFVRPPFWDFKKFFFLALGSPLLATREVFSNWMQKTKILNILFERNFCQWNCAENPGFGGKKGSYEEQEEWELGSGRSGGKRIKIFICFIFSKKYVILVWLKDLSL